MKKQFFWMWFKAILKIVIPIGIAVVLIPELLKEELAAIITIFCTMGLAGLIYVISGILTLKNGAKQARKYIHSYPGGMNALNEEYENAEEFSDARIGQSHLFANASDGFYIVPFEKIEEVFVRHEGANPVKGRPGYYYLYIKMDGIGGIDNMIKIYYLKEHKARGAQTVLEQRLRIGEGV